MANTDAPTERNMMWELVRAVLEFKKGKKIQSTLETIPEDGTPSRIPSREENHSEPRKGPKESSRYSRSRKKKSASESSTSPGLSSIGSGSSLRTIASDTRSGSNLSFDAALGE